MIAITRGVSPSIAHCELTHLEREPIVYQRAAEQHAIYQKVLEDLGCRVIEIAADTNYPDCVFIEDTAIVLDEMAVITRPGAESRRGETGAVAEELARHRRLERIAAPATLDGGDLLLLGSTIFAGLTPRTAGDAHDQLRSLTGYEVVSVRVDGCLHLKSAVTRVSADALLINSEWIDPRPFEGWTLIGIDPEEPFAANALMIGDAVVYSSAFPRTRARLESHGVKVVPLDATELAKAEGGVTCCSLVFRA